jgi:hypothetical protein
MNVRSGSVGQVARSHEVHLDNPFKRTSDEVLPSTFSLLEKADGVRTISDIADMDLDDRGLWELYHLWQERFVQLRPKKG